MNSSCAMSSSNSDKYGTVIHQIRIFGHPYTEILQRVISWDRGNVTEPVTCEYRGEHKALRISNMNLDWCLAGDFEMTVTPDSTNAPDQSEKCLKPEFISKHVGRSQLRLHTSENYT